MFYSEIPANSMVQRFRVGYLTGQILRKRITMRGFIIFEDFGSFYPEFAAEMNGWLKAGKIHYREEIVDGLEKAPATFIGMLNGDTIGKCVIHVGHHSLPVVL